MSSTGTNVILSVSPLGGTSFYLNDFKGIERLSNLFEYTLLMTAQSNSVNFSSIMGQSATVSLTIGSDVRTYNGIVGKFEQVGTPFTALGAWTAYRATLYPSLWLLQFSGQCRIFQNQTIISIITSVLDQDQVTYSNQVSSAGSETVDFCVQYNETDFNFISRLMEGVGIFYFFQQTENGHTLVLADSVSNYATCPNASSVSFQDATPKEQFLNIVTSCFLTQRIVPQANTLVSYNYLTPQTPLSATATGPSNAGGGSITTYDEIYGQQTTGTQLVTVKLQSEDFPQQMAEGGSTVPFFLAGYSFQLQNHPRADANISYALYEVIHEAHILEKGSQKSLYKNTFKAFPATILFQAPQKTAKPRIYSTQTAVVTGASGQDIYTEQYGRIKVKFHWDPSPNQDETTSCWIRVATLWAGQTWGTLFTPRVGQEVVVSFIDGDPDNPLVVGAVYNGVNNPPYLPSDPTRSTIKSQTSPSSGEATPGYNEISIEDQQGSEQINVYAQKDFNITVQNDQNITIVGGNRTIVLQSQDEQNETRTSQQSNDSLKLMNGTKSVEIVQGDYTILLDQGNMSITCSSGNLNVQVTGDISFNCTGNFGITAGQDISLQATGKITDQAGTDVSITAGGGVTITAGADLAEKAGGAATITAGADFSATAGGAATVDATGDTSIKGGGAVEITGGGTVSIKGATIEETAGIIMLNG
ncbi:MAG: type VI secretion system tip protein VgrG [Alphaproteobacteria bacterium]|nr:type VI secretion system tip protein VgrG [Alphaproteobacteria bacterium]